MDERPVTITVPTELERSDAVWDIVIGLAAALVVLQCVKPPDMGGFGMPWYAPSPFLILLAIWVLTGEGAADIPYLGNVAAGLRSKFGLRRAHEWVLAYRHYAEMRVLPDWKDRLYQWKEVSQAQTVKCCQRAYGVVARIWNQSKPVNARRVVARVIAVRRVVSGGRMNGLTK